MFIFLILSNPYLIYVELIIFHYFTLTIYKFMVFKHYAGQLALRRGVKG